jgi:hypothetical protein
VNKKAVPIAGAVSLRTSSLVGGIEIVATVRTSSFACLLCKSCAAIWFWPAFRRSAILGRRCHGIGMVRLWPLFQSGSRSPRFLAYPHTDPGRGRIRVLSEIALHQLSVSSRGLGRILPSYCAVFAYCLGLRMEMSGSFQKAKNYSAARSGAAGRRSGDRSAGCRRTGQL